MAYSMLRCAVIVFNELTEVLNSNDRPASAVLNRQPSASSTVTIHSQIPSRLLVIILSLIVNHVEEPQLIHALTRADHPQPISQLLLLQELLGQVLQIPA